MRLVEDTSSHGDDSVNSTKQAWTNNRCSDGPRLSPANKLSNSHHSWADSPPVLTIITRRQPLVGRFDGLGATMQTSAQITPSRTSSTDKIPNGGEW